jgi:hypothetical protein
MFDVTAPGLNLTEFHGQLLANPPIVMFFTILTIHESIYHRI